jgi:hypothetical protein
LFHSNPRPPHGAKKSARLCQYNGGNLGLDTSGNNNHPTISGGAASGTGKFGNGLELDNGLSSMLSGTIFLLTTRPTPSAPAAPPACISSLQVDPSAAQCHRF